MTVTIRPAASTDSAGLTEISFAAKRYWHYPDEYFAVWKDELTITPAYIQTNRVYVAETAGQIAAYFSLAEVKEDYRAGNVLVQQGLWLEHIFVRPEYISQGIGTRLITCLKSLCQSLAVDKVRIFSDPNAKGFYNKINARYMGETPSNIPGRNVSLYELDIK